MRPRRPTVAAEPAVTTKPHPSVARLGSGFRSRWWVLVVLLLLLPRLPEPGEQVPTWQGSPQVLGSPGVRQQYAPDRLLALFGQGVDASMAWQRWVRHWSEQHTDVARSLVASTPEATVLNVEDDSLRQLLGLEVRTIVIDPGHGGRDPGAVGATGLTEKEINLAVAIALRERLAKQSGLYVLLTREEDISLSLRDRVSFANLHGADLFISIHVNSLAQEMRPFVETFYPGTDNANAISREQLALENRYSGYSVGEFRQLLDGLGDRFRHGESRRLAGSIQQSLFANMRRHNPELLSGGLKNAPFVVLLGTRMPAVLVEISSLSNRDEEARLATREYRRLIVDYLERGILEYLHDRRVNKEGAAHYASQENLSGGQQ